MSDTRNRNISFKTDSISVYLSEYSKFLQAALDVVDREQLQLAHNALMDAQENGRQIFVAGNGGSAAISEHLECDFQKGCHVGSGTLKTRSLCSNVAVLTAIGNDLGFEKVFSYQLELIDTKTSDILILISSSGNSPNIIEAANYAKNKGMLLIGLTGFDGGKLKELADISLHVPFANYGIVEDAHQAMIHALAQFQYLTLK